LNRSTKNPPILWGVVWLPLLAFAQPLSLFNHFDKKHYNFSLQYRNANDAIAIKDEAQYTWNAKGYSPKEGSNIAIISHRADIGMGIGDWYLGYALRYEMFVQTDKQTTDILQLVNTKSDLPLGERYDALLSVYGLASHNLVLSKSFVINPNFKAFGGVELLQAFGMQEGFVDAYADIVSTKTYDFEGYSEYYYHKNLLYSLDVEKPLGYGYSLKMGLEYQHAQHTLTLLIEDFASAIYWHALPYSEVSILSNTKEYDKDGYVKYKPSLSGFELYKEHTQRLEAKYQLTYNYKPNDIFDTTLGVGYYQDFLLPFASLTYHSDSNIDYTLGYEGRFGALMLGIELYDFKASIAINDIEYPSALNVHLSYAF